ncbi:hypothetical protein [Devosia sp.]|uniref:hypothetical protein n=1 Tax=Devosia sp. TaxID=1871048 RepID=UPI003F72DCA4
MPSTTALETRILAGAGFTVQEMAWHFGVNRATIYRQSGFAPDFMQSLKEGREAFVALEAAAAAAQAAETAAAERRDTQEAARAAGELFRDLMPPPVPPGTSPSRGLPIAERQDGPEEPWRQDATAGEPIPFDDPLRDWN